MTISSRVSSDLEKRDLGFYIAFLLIATGYALSAVLDVSVGKIVFGLVVIGYLPGALLIRLLFYRLGKLTALENIVLSMVFSFVLCVGLGLLLNMLPKGLSPTNINLALWGLVALLFVLNLAFRRMQAGQSAPADQRRSFPLEQIRARLSKAELVAYSMFLVIALICLAMLAFLIVRVESGERFTEFYVLGPEGQAASYPREVVAGEPVSVTAGITNRERVPADYRIQLRVGDRQLGTEGSIALADGETWKQPYTFTITQPGADQKVEFLLYRSDEAEPYRSLYLWITVLDTE